MRLLLIEDNKVSGGDLSSQLKPHNYFIDMAFTHTAGLKLASSNVYHLLLIKYNSLCLHLISSIRQSGIITPILVYGSTCTAHEIYKIIDHGANDFLEWPFKIEDLLIRFKVMSKKFVVSQDHLIYGDLSFQYSKKMLTTKSHDIRLTKKEADLLHYLIINQKIIVSKAQLMNQLWRHQRELNDNNIEVHISTLRKKIKQLQSQVSIINKRHIGYFLVFNKPRTK